MVPGGGVGLVVALVVLFVAVALGAWPVVRRLTRRLEALQRGVETFGAGQLSHRVDAGGRDEVAAVATSFNRAAERIEALVASHRSLLANASHELRSPLARLKMALSLLETAGPESRVRLQGEIECNIRELDALVEEVLLASRLDAPRETDPRERVALLPLAAEEASRVNAVVGGDDAVVQGDERLLRRALRNLLENAQRYGSGEPPEVSVVADSREVQLRVADRGPGVPETARERIFEPFYRLPGHAEQAGGVGLGLSLVRQIAHAHRGTVHCEPRPGGGSVFVLSLPR
jgi:signal transduction histidine kinase